jgi:hypothetical protein
VGGVKQSVSRVFGVELVGEALGRRRRGWDIEKKLM